MKSIASDLVSELDIDIGNTRVGGMLVGETQTTVFFLNVHTTTAAVQSVISSLTFSGPAPNGLTKMEAALSITRAFMLTAGSGDRSDAPNAVVLLTDGPSAYPTTTQVSIGPTIRIIIKMYSPYVCYAANKVQTINHVVPRTPLVKVN